MNQNTKSSSALRTMAIVLLLSLSAAGLYACPEKEKGPLERTGEKVDETVDDAKRAVEDAGD